MGKSWLPRYSDLHPDQIPVCHFPLERNYLITGPAGAGKTVIALYRAFVQRAKHPNLEIQIFAYTKVLRKFIQDGLGTLKLPSECVGTFYTWVWKLYRNTTGRTPPKDPWGNVDWRGVLQGLMRHVATEGGIHTKWDLVLVDEGQDLPVETYHLLQRFARSITVTADSAQAIFEDSSNVDAIRGALGLRQDSAHLLHNYRTSKRIAQLAAPLLETREQSASFIHSTGGHRREEEQPILYEAPTRQEELDWLCKQIRDCLGNQRVVAVLTPDKRPWEALEQAFRGQNMPLQQVDPTRGVDDTDFNDLTPKLITIFSAKGLEFDDVFLPGMVHGVFGDWIKHPRRLLFVAITRAKQNVYISGIKGSLHPLIEELDLSVVHRVDPAQQVKIDDLILDASESDEDDLPF